MSATLGLAVIRFGLISMLQAWAVILESKLLPKDSTYLYWPRMLKDITAWNAECDVCQQNKTDTVPYPGLLQLLSVPSKPWIDISLDFIEGLP